MTLPETRAMHGALSGRRDAVGTMETNDHERSDRNGNRDRNVKKIVTCHLPTAVP
jgi:hypothetical protein